MKKYILFILFSISMLSCGQSQTLSTSDELSRKKADIVLSNSKIAGKINGKPYLFFSINNTWYLIITKNGTTFEEIYFNLNSSNEIILFNHNKIKEVKQFLINAFDKSKYHEGFINLNSSFYKSGYEISSGNPTYFFFVDEEGNKFGESKLTTIINPNPIDTNLYNYLLSMTLTHIEK